MKELLQPRAEAANTSLPATNLVCIYAAMELGPEDFVSR